MSNGCEYYIFLKKNKVINFTTKLTGNCNAEVQFPLLLWREDVVCGLAAGERWYSGFRGTARGGWLTQLSTMV